MIERQVCHVLRVALRGVVGTSALETICETVCADLRYIEWRNIVGHELSVTALVSGTRLRFAGFRGNLADGGDLAVPEDGPVSVIWAMGKMAERAHRVKEPSFHHSYTRQHTQINFGQKEHSDDCFAFNTDRKEILTPWPIPPIWDATRRTFNARLGPAGGRRGFSGKTNLPASSQVW